MMGPKAGLVVVVLFLSPVSAWGESQQLDWHGLLEQPEPRELLALAVGHERAPGERRDYSRARQFYCAAARLGDLSAQLRLAWMYANGVGAPQDKALAGAWLRAAAAQGSLQARRFLALLGEAAPRGRQPRCTYLSRYDRYALATIPSPHSGNRESTNGAGTTALARGLTVERGSAEASRAQIGQWVRQLAPDYGLDPQLVLAVIAVESNFNPKAVSPKNAQGLMQLIPSTAARFGVRDVTHPIQNLHGGMAYLRWLLAFFRGELALALAGYNAGEGAVQKHQGIPPYPETQTYVRKVMRAYGRKEHPRIDPAFGGPDAVPVSLQRP